ncbi:MAG: hypothetical protein KDF24_05795 [Rhodocyclaceae bacterium]|nr:hypothetical protein [Rhodocyclaceae bacterium]MCB1962663.1 hypothetical protein [Rhodocyclaceae bacterium]
MKNPTLRRALLCAALAGATGAALADEIARVMPGDQALACSDIHAEQSRLDAIIAAGDPQAGAVGKAAAGTAANVGGQVAGGAVAQSVGGLFGALGSVVGKVAGAVAQQSAEAHMAPDAATIERAAQAQTRKDFLARLALARDCRTDDPSRTGKPLSTAEFAALSAAPTPLPAAGGTPLNAASIAPIVGAELTPAGKSLPLEGNFNLAGKRYYIAEYLVYFDVAGEVSASTRAGYLPGRDYGATHVRVKYEVPDLDIAAFQAITDRSWQDFTARLAAAGVALENRADFVAQNGVVYGDYENASQPGAPVFVEQNQGHSERKFLVMSPTGMQKLSRGFAGLGAGNMGTRMDWVKGNLEAVSVAVTINIAALESSGSGSSILNRSSSANAGAAMSISGPPPDKAVLFSHANAMSVRLSDAVTIDGNFSTFRETGGWDSSTDGVAVAMNALNNLAGRAGNSSKRVDMAVDLDGPATARMSLSALADFNAAIAQRLAP